MGEIFNEYFKPEKIDQGEAQRMKKTLKPTCSKKSAMKMIRGNVGKTPREAGRLRLTLCPLDEPITFDFEAAQEMKDFASCYIGALYEDQQLLNRLKRKFDNGARLPRRHH